MKYCHNKNDVPTTAHYAIVEFSSYTIPGDERSRTNPGHGYPESTGYAATYIAFTDRVEWEKEVASRAAKVFGDHNFVAMYVNPARTLLDVRIEVDTTFKR